jgi:hypothetical protein
MMNKASGAHREKVPRNDCSVRVGFEGTLLKKNVVKIDDLQLSRSFSPSLYICVIIPKHNDR